MLCYSIYLGLWTLAIQILFNAIPYNEKSNLQIMRLVTTGVCPERLQSPEMEDETWDLIRSCWNSKPSERPTMEQIVKTLTLRAY